MSNNTQGFNFGIPPYATPVEGRKQKKPVNFNNGMGLSYVPPQQLSTANQVAMKLPSMEAQSAISTVGSLIIDPKDPKYKNYPFIQYTGRHSAPAEQLQGSFQMNTHLSRVQRLLKEAFTTIDRVAKQNGKLSDEEKQRLADIVLAIQNDVAFTKNAYNPQYLEYIQQFALLDENEGISVKDYYDGSGLKKLIEAKGLLKGGKRKNQRKTKKQKRKAKKTRKH